MDRFVAVALERLCGNHNEAFFLLDCAVRLQEILIFIFLEDLSHDIFFDDVSHLGLGDELNSVDVAS